MSRNYIKALLKPFRESRVVGALLKLLEPGGGDAVPAAQGVKNEVNLCFSLNLFSYMYFEVRSGFLFIFLLLSIKHDQIDVGNKS